MARQKLYKTSHDRYLAHKESENARSRAYHCANREKLLPAMSERRYKLTYGITRADKDAMLAAQGGVCAICGTNDPKGRWPWQVDHNHETGKVRGILCHHCNLTLGNAKENVRRLRLAALYLEKHNGKTPPHVDLYVCQGPEQWSQ